MKKPAFSLAAYKDPSTVELINSTNHKTLAVWAIDCTERVIPYFEDSYPNDLRPRQAIETLRDWLDTGIFNMGVIRKASLSAHAAAKEIGNDTQAASAAHAAGQAVATAHVPMHSLGAANYALQAVHRASKAEEFASAIIKERDWQLRRLNELTEI